MIASGRAVVDEKTKNLLKRIKPGQIAVIKHKDLDELAASELVKLKVKAVINYESSITGTFHNRGPSMLWEAGIPLIDIQKKFGEIKEGDYIQIDKESCVYVNKKFYCGGTLIDEKIILQKQEESQKKYDTELEKFAINTLNFITQEKYLLSEKFTMPDLTTPIENRHVLVVVRGHDYKQDLYTLRSYIDEFKPVLIGVDGGADVLLEFGLKPNIIIGDMDSISDKGLICGAELVVHAYMNGRAPGVERLKQKNLSYHILAMPGTSEDCALLLAYEKKADLIVIVGSHTNIIDFLEKGRHGMASTFIVRLKVGHKLIDAKGVNKLYKNEVKIKYIAAICCAASFPLIVIGVTSPAFQHLMRLLFIQVRLIFGMF